MFIEPEATKEGDTRKTTAAGRQFPASQGAEGKAQEQKTLGMSMCTLDIRHYPPRKQRMV